MGPSGHLLRPIPSRAPGHGSGFRRGHPPAVSGGGLSRLGGIGDLVRGPGVAGGNGGKEPAGRSASGWPGPTGSSWLLAVVIFVAVGVVVVQDPRGRPEEERVEEDGSEDDRMKRRLGVPPGAVRGLSLLRAGAFRPDPLGLSEGSEEAPGFWRTGSRAARSRSPPRTSGSSSST